MVTFDLGPATGKYSYDEFLIQSQQYPLIFPQCTPYGVLPSYPINVTTTVTTPFPDVNRDVYINNIVDMFTPFGFTDINVNKTNLLLNEILMDIGAFYPTDRNSAEIFGTISNLVALAGSLPVTTFKDVIAIQEVITWAGIGNCFTWNQRSQIVLLSLYPVNTGSASTDWFLLLRSLSWYWYAYEAPVTPTGYEFLSSANWAALVALANQKGCKTDFAKLANMPPLTVEVSLGGGLETPAYVALVVGTLIYNICLLYPVILITNQSVKEALSATISNISFNIDIPQSMLYTIVTFYATNMLLIPSNADIGCCPTVKCDDTTYCKTPKKSKKSLRRF
jgi:hypothetical protein